MAIPKPTIPPYIEAFMKSEREGKCMPPEKRGKKLYTYCGVSFGNGRPNATTGKKGVIIKLSTMEESQMGPC